MSDVIRTSKAMAVRVAERVIQAICDYDDRTSPDDNPHMLLVTGAELHAEILSAFEAESDSSETPACAVLQAAEELLEVLPVPNDYYGDEAQTLREALDNARKSSPETGDQRDAERYRFLVGECGASMLQSYFSVYDVKDWRGVKPALDKAIDSAMERDGSQKALEPRTESILDRKVTVCADCLCASCWQGDLYCDNAKTAGTVEKTIRELFQINANGVREDSGYWFKDPNTGKVDYDAKSAAKRALNAENGNSQA